MTPIDLHSKTRKELSEIARDRSIQRWHSMKKQELINALIALNKKENPRKSFESDKQDSPGDKNLDKGWKSCSRKNDSSLVEQVKAHSHLTGGADLDELHLQVANPAWVFAKWAFKTESLERAAVALGRKWHSAKPVLRIYEISDECSSSENLLRHEIEIHGNVNHWYVHIDHVPVTIVASIGYLTNQGEFYVLAKSARTEVKQSIIKSEKPSTALLDSSMEDGVLNEIDFQLDVELLLKGSAHPHAEIDLDGDMIRANGQGEFEFRMDLPNGRQVIPAIVVSQDGEARKTIVLGLERSTRELDAEMLSQP